MNFLSNILFKIKPIRKYAERQYLQHVVNRYFVGAKTSRLVNDWITELESINVALKNEYRQLLVRSRELAANNDYVKGFIKRCVTNIIGHKGFTLQNRAIRNNQPDDEINQLVENKFDEWSKREYADVNKSLSFCEMQKLMVKQWKRDGNVLIRKVYDKKNKFGFALQLLDVDSLAIKYNDRLSNGNVVKMGIEFNKYNQRVAYHFYVDNNNDSYFNYYSYNYYNNTVRIPAEEIIHFYTSDYPSQILGIPAITSSLITLHNLRGYDEAAIINARAGAYKMGFIQTQPNQNLHSQYVGDKIDDQGNIISEFAPGVIELLPAGLEYKGWDPSYPHGEYPSFVKAILRRIATGIGVAYANWVGDLESVNYSSMRSGLLDERDNWKDDQSSFIDGVMIPIFNEWLKYAILNKQINVSFADYDKVCKPEFIGRRWDWVDPRADIEAKVMAVKNNLTTLTDVMAEMGVDFEDYIRRRKKELEKLKEIKELEMEIYPDKVMMNKTNNNGNGKSYQHYYEVNR